MNITRLFRFGITLAAIQLGYTAQLRAAPVSFTIDESQSSITLAGTVLGNPLQEQGQGSLVTSFHGTILADASATAVQFTGGSVLAAQTNGVWQPGLGGASGSAPADYAAKASTILGSIKGALRNLVLDLSSGVLPLNNGQFDGGALLFAFPTNSTATFDYDAGPLLGSDGITLEGVSTNRVASGATLETTADGQKLVISVDAEFKFTAVIENDSSVRFTGTLVANAIPEPTITGIEVNGQSVILHVQNAGPTPSLFSSADLQQWTLRSPDRSTDANGVVLTLPATAAQEFFRVAK